MDEKRRNKRERNVINRGLRIVAKNRVYTHVKRAWQNIYTWIKELEENEAEGRIEEMRRNRNRRGSTGQIECLYFTCESCEAFMCSERMGKWETYERTGWPGDKASWDREKSIYRIETMDIRIAKEDRIGVRESRIENIGVESDAPSRAAYCLIAFQIRVHKCSFRCALQKSATTVMHMTLKSTW